MEYQPNRPQEEDIEEPDEAKEHLHVNPRLLANPDLEQSDVESVEHRGGEREEVSQYRVRVFFAVYESLDRVGNYGDDVGWGGGL